MCLMMICIRYDVKTDLKITWESLSSRLNDKILVGQIHIHIRVRKILTYRVQMVD